MNTKRQNTFPLFAAALLALASARSATAQLLTDINLDQAVQESGDNGNLSKTVTDTVAPYQYSATVSFYGVGSITANYSLTDNGSVATFDINCTGSITTGALSVDEGTVDAPDGSFRLTQPCRYVLTLSCNGSSSSELDYDDPGPYGIFGDVSNTTRTYSGTMGAVPFNLYETWGLTNNIPVPTNQYGTDSISLTLYATEPIPEPSTAVLIGLSAVAMLGRRRRPPASPSRWEGDSNVVASGQAL